jgi:23S rRNA (cytidine2498-2'-O)-methyltransferase
MLAFLWAEDSETELRSELAQSFPEAQVRTAPGNLFEVDSDIRLSVRLPYLVFARQMVANARRVQAESIRGWAGKLFEAVAGVLPDNQPWSLWIEPRYGACTIPRMGARAWHSARREHSEENRVPNGKTGQFGAGLTSNVGAEAGRQRCRLIREAFEEILRKKRRHLLRQLRAEPAPFTSEDSHAQLLLTTPDEGYISIATAPMPFEQRHLLSPFPKGDIPLAMDKLAPSRAFAKLVEAELRLGYAIRSSETCVDLGASPGSWTYVAAGRGARVIAVDRSPLREDLMRNPQVQFEEGDAFRFRPHQPVDWLLCDVIAAPERTAELLLEWLRRGWCRNFVVTVKLKAGVGTDVVATLKRELPMLTEELFLTRLCANKREICVFGRRAISCPAIP